MKKKALFFVFIAFFSIYAFSQKIVETQYFRANKELGGEVVIKNSTKEVKQNKSYVSFEVETQQAGKYFVNF